MISSNRIGLATGLLTCLTVVACGQQESSSESAAPPSHVDNAVAESTLTTVTLTPDAVARLGIETADVERRAVTLNRTLGGELMIPPGRRMIVNATSAGIVVGPAGQSLPEPGIRVAAGDVLMRLIPLPSDSNLLTAQADIAVRESDFLAAEAKANRARELLSGGSGTEQQVEQSRAELVRAEAALRIARSQAGLLSGAGIGDLTSVELATGRGGELTALHVAAGQVVAAGAPLFEVADRAKLWLRVPVYAAELERLDPEAPASVAPVGNRPDDSNVIARRIAGTPTANPAAASIDMFYALDNSDLKFRSGERVQVYVPLRGSGERLVVPWSAVFRDFEGGAWVYVQTAAGTYVRTRVAVEHVVDDVAVLSRGPDPGTRVVTVAVAELAGTEFGVDH